MNNYRSMIPEEIGIMYKLLVQSQKQDVRNYMFKNENSAVSLNFGYKVHTSSFTGN